MSSVTIQTLETTYKSSTNAAAVEAMLVKITEKPGPMVRSSGHANAYERVLILTWRSFLNMSRDFGYFWLRLVLYMLLMICIGTTFSHLGHTLYSVRVRVAAIFISVAFTSFMSIGGFPPHIREIKLYTSCLV